MAEEYKDIDDLFRAKLERHSVNPSPLAWQKLQRRMGKKKKKTPPWLMIAASLFLLLGLSALLWMGLRQTGENLEPLADLEPDLVIIQEEPAPEQPPYSEDTVDEKVVSVEKHPPIQPAVQKTDPKPDKRRLASGRPADAAPPVREVALVQEVKEIALPPLDSKLLLAETNIQGPKEVLPQEVTYKVTIISKGLKDSPEKQTLVGEIENKIDKIGGFIGKVDQGLADLQDAKNNLFANLTAK